MEHYILHSTLHDILVNKKSIMKCFYFCAHVYTEPHILSIIVKHVIASFVSNIYPIVAQISIITRKALMCIQYVS